MKLENACITFLVSEDKTTIELRDRNAATIFARVELTAVQLSQMLSRISNTDCQCEVFGLDRVGKKHEHETWEFEISQDLRGSQNSEELHKMALKSLALAGMDWMPDGYFGSKDSFFTRDGKDFARVTIRRWT